MIQRRQCRINSWLPVRRIRSWSAACRRRLRFRYRRSCWTARDRLRQVAVWLAIHHPSFFLVQPKGHDRVEVFPGRCLATRFRLLLFLLLQFASQQFCHQVVRFSLSALVAPEINDWPDNYLLPVVEVVSGRPKNEVAIVSCGFLRFKAQFVNLSINGNNPEIMTNYYWYEGGNTVEFGCNFPVIVTVSETALQTRFRHL